MLVVAGSAGKVGSSLLTARAAMRAGAGLVTICTLARRDRLARVARRRGDDGAASTRDRIDASLDEALARRTRRRDRPGPRPRRARARRGRSRRARLGGRQGRRRRRAHALRRSRRRARRRQGAVHPDAASRRARAAPRQERAAPSSRTASARCARPSRGRAPSWCSRARAPSSRTPDVDACSSAWRATPRSRPPARATCSPASSPRSRAALPPVRAACAGVLVHALAGDRWLARTGGDRGMLASEIAEAVPGILAALARGADPLSPSRERCRSLTHTSVCPERHSGLVIQALNLVRGSGIRGCDPYRRDDATGGPDRCSTLTRPSVAQHQQPVPAPRACAALREPA